MNYIFKKIVLLSMVIAPVSTRLFASLNELRGNNFLLPAAAVVGCGLLYCHQNKINVGNAVRTTFTNLRNFACNHSVIALLGSAAGLGAMSYWSKISTLNRVQQLGVANIGLGVLGTLSLSCHFFQHLNEKTLLTENLYLKSELARAGQVAEIARTAETAAMAAYEQVEEKLCNLKLQLAQLQTQQASLVQAPAASVARPAEAPADNAEPPTDRAARRLLFVKRTGNILHPVVSNTDDK